MSGKKIYLDGFDWAANLLNHQCRRTPGAGNHFTLVLQTSDDIDESAIRSFLRPLEKYRDFLCGTIKRHRLHLAPYWEAGKPEDIPVTSETIPSQSDFPSAMERFCNAPLPKKRTLAVHAVRHQDGSSLLFKFSHLLFDGRGAELLLEALRSRSYSLFGEEAPGQPTPRLNEWEKQFSSGKQVQSRLISINRDGKIFSRKASDSASSAYRVISLSETETELLRARADQEAGPFMLTPYLLALTSSVYREQLAGKESGNILIPMSIDMRGQDNIPSDAIFFNQWSILPVHIKQDVFAEMEKLIPEIRKQIFINTGERIALAYRAASRLTRIAPPGILLGIMRKIGNTTSGSFMFSFLSGTSLEQKPLAGKTVTNLFHLPSMPPITGLGVFFNMFNARLNAVISYRTGVFPEADMERFSAELERKLKGEK